MCLYFAIIFCYHLAFVQLLDVGLLGWLKISFPFEHSVTLHYITFFNVA